MIIQEFKDQDREWARRLLEKRWGSSEVVTLAVLHHADKLPGFVALVDGKRKGLITCRISNGECEVVTLDSLLERRGIGTALVDSVRKLAHSRRCLRMWLITTNDNISAQEFYQKRGFRIVAVHKNTIDKARKLRPEIPEKGINGIPIRDEIEMEILLT